MLPSKFLPFMAKKISFFLINLELMEASLINILFDKFNCDCSWIILSFIFLDKDLFFVLIELRITF